MKLTKVIDVKSGGEYKLSYNEDYPLPHRLSNSQDFWGVFNGQANSSTPIPTTIYTLNNTQYEPKRLFIGADKWPNFNYGVVGNLIKLQYPTGGFTEITYEPDDYIQGMHTPISKYNYLQKGANMSTTQSGNELFSISLPSYEMKIEFTGDNDDGSGTTNIENCEMEIYKGNSSIFSSKQYGIFHKYNSYEIGEYSIEMTPGYDVDTQNRIDCTASLSWYEEELVNNSPYQQTGTLRVNKIHSYDQNNGEIIREFTYLDLSNNQSSGKNLGEENFVALYTNESPVGGAGTTLKHLFLSNNPGWQTSTVRGKPIGYDYVQEIYKDSFKSFKKEYKFYNDFDDQWASHNPYSASNYTWPIKGIRRGLMLGEKLFNQENETIQESIFDYNFNSYFNKDASTFIEDVSIVGYGLELDLKSLTTTNLGDIYTFNSEIFPIRNYWFQNVKTTTTEYENNHPTLVTEKISKYSPAISSENPIHTFPIEYESQNSLGETLKTEFEYPQDLTSNYQQSTMMQNMVDRNILSRPIRIKTYNDDIPTSEQRTFYKNLNDMILPEFIYAKKGAMGSNVSAEDREIAYDDYDDKGNLLQYTLENGTPVSIVWGYNGQYPIAKVEGVDYGSIQTLVNAENGIIKLSNTGSLTSGSFETLRNTTGALVTSYIYEPLVGVTTIIQPNGQKEKYEYDSAGRLKFIKDHNGNVLKEMEYHYSNQN